MKRQTQFVVDTAGLLGQAGSRLVLRTEVQLSDMALSDFGVGEWSIVDARLFVDLVLECTGSDGNVSDSDDDDSQRYATGGVVVVGTATGTWSVPCRRCLEPMQGDLVAEIRELFEVAPTEGETWPLRDDGIDLGPMLRETALLGLPLAPLCRVECAGPAPDRFPTGPADDYASGIDPRWSVLDELTFDG